MVIGMNIFTRILNALFNQENINIEKGGYVMNGKYCVDDVARYIINYCHDRKYIISNLKLQKILYFVQAKFLTETTYPCFSEEIEAWNFGPVVPQVYSEYKKFGSGNIPRIKTYYKYNKDDYFSMEKCNYTSDVICKDDQLLINSMVDSCSDYSASQLVTITHRQAPWRNAFSPYLNNVITKESIKSFFEEQI